MTIADHDKHELNSAGDGVARNNAATTLLAHSASSTEQQSSDGDDEDPESSSGPGNGEGRRVKSRNRVNDDDVRDYDNEQQETERLLAEETNALNNPSVSNIANVDTLPQPPPPPTTAPDDEIPATWRGLPRKSQLAILTLARLSEPLTQTSLQAYMFYQLKTFPTDSGEPPSDSTVATQAGVLAAAFTGAQFLTALLWGRLADSEYMGRKRVILIGLVGTAVGSLGFGFSRSFSAAVFWRCVGGCLNGNIGVMRTMISEIVREKKWLSRAFLLLPMTFNIGVVIGPVLGGVLADVAGSYPGVFGKGAALGWQWLRIWPYALPNVVMACFLVASAMGVVLGLEETLDGRREESDWGLRLGQWILRVVFRRKGTEKYVQLAGDESAAEDANEDIEMRASPRIAHAKKAGPTIKRRLPFRRIWTKNVCCTLLAHGLLATHVGTFNSLWFVFVSTSRYDPSPSQHKQAPDNTLSLPEGYTPHPPFTFTGGLALPPTSIGAALAILGVFGLCMQLLLYPPLSFKLGMLRSFRYFLMLFPIAYLLTPFLSLIPSTNPPPGQATGFLVWAGIAVVLFVQVLGRTFALPATAILVNNASPHPSVLGTVHGLAQSASSGARTIGPVVAGWGYGVGLRNGMVGAAWWGLGVLAVFGAVSSWWVREGDGREIWLEGEEEEEKPG